MPGPADDDELFQKMFASFVERKTRSSNPSSTVRPPFIDFKPEMRKSSGNNHPDYTLPPSSPNIAGLRIQSPTSSSSHNSSQLVRHSSHHPSLPTRQQSHHHSRSTSQHYSVLPQPTLSRHQSSHVSSSSTSQRHAQDSRGAPLHSLLNFRQSQPSSYPQQAEAADQASSKRHSKGSKGSKASRSASKGSNKGSEKPVSASTEDAPPRKRTRTHGALHRSQSAHVGVLNQRSSSSKPEASPTTAPKPVSGSSSKTAQKSFPCDKCKATFAQRGQLSRHVRRVHEKLRPYACEYCGRLFGAKSDRTRHVMIVHKKVRQFPCERCGFHFQAKTHLEAHIRTVHDGERPYRCEQCGFSFGLRSNLLTHERAVHYREAKWNCKVCDAAFNRKHDMFRHMKLMHDMDSSGQTSSATKK